MKPHPPHSPALTLSLLASLACAPTTALHAQDIHVDSLGHDSGAVDARVHVVELSDFACTYCRSFHLETYPILHDEFVATGEVRWKYVTFVSGMFPNSMEASIVAECVAEQGLFDAMRDRLFQEQPKWRGLDDPEPALLGYAAEVGADVAEIGECIADGRVEPRIDQARRFSLLSGVRGTPTFLIDGFPLMGALPIEFLRDILQRRLEAPGEGHGRP
jgi:protein-disulfide isomerase